MNKRFLIGWLVVSMLACEPMIAIGKYEFLILIVLIGVLLGPTLHRLLRRIEEFWKLKQKDE